MLKNPYLWPPTFEPDWLAALIEFKKLQSLAELGTKPGPTKPWRD
jgi:hypothetical protein